MSDPVQRSPSVWSQVPQGVIGSSHIAPYPFKKRLYLKLIQNKKVEMKEKGQKNGEGMSVLAALVKSSIEGAASMVKEEAVSSVESDFASIFDINNRHELKITKEIRERNKMFNFIHSFQRWIKPVVAEFVATFILLFWACMLQPEVSLL